MDLNIKLPESTFKQPEQISGIPVPPATVAVVPNTPLPFPVTVSVPESLKR